MPSFELRYLNLNGKAESIRLLFEYLKVPYVDFRQDYLDYSKTKANPPLPRMPYLIVDDGSKALELCYTSVIMEYVAGLYGLLPESYKDQSLARLWGHRLDDYINELKPLYYSFLYTELFKTQNDAIKTVFYPTMMEDFSVLMEAQLTKNGTGFVVGNKLSWIDFYCAHFVELNMKLVPEANYAKFPKIQAHRELVFSLPELQDYLKTRKIEIL
ncbi:unnamed protein product [Bursaphelenchus xylophilus]|uniref:(pine wood nematode) hypothetical protein n=1 Tax=Bursaphelenchus xylophilus TaxID=6326 RepID=A0A1I7RV26_BURXY|nr:unnamed protein product [Bursaphelenchus xylophilus]CAG9105178.1 unnamed protein product [Bursaphelenchus xylophilus]